LIVARELLEAHVTQNELVRDSINQLELFTQGERRKREEVEVRLALTKKSNG
jgi:hypothetical protein